jgi:hypothetical protein
LQIIVAVAINKERPPLPSDTPPRMASLILRCWSENPAGRPRVDELLAELEDMMRVRNSFYQWIECTLISCLVIGTRNQPDEQPPSFLRQCCCVCWPTS